MDRVKGDSSRHPGHTYLQSPTERPTHHDRIDRPIHPTCLRCLSTWSWPGRVAATRLATVQPRTIVVCDPRERLEPLRPTVRISSPEMLSYTICFRQGLSYTLGRFRPSIWTVWIPSGYHLFAEQAAVPHTPPARFVTVSFTYMRSEVDCILRTSPLVLSFSRGATRYAVCNITLLSDTREKGRLWTLPQRLPNCRGGWWIRPNDAMR